MVKGKAGDFIGTEFPTPSGGILTVTGVGSKNKWGYYNYTISCSICSKDVELFPDSFKLTKGCLTKGTLPCGCSSSPRWTEYQMQVKVSRICQTKGYIFLGWHGEYRGSYTKIKLHNPATKKHME